MSRYTGRVARHEIMGIGCVLAVRYEAFVLDNGKPIAHSGVWRNTIKEAVEDFAAKELFQEV